MKLTRFFLSFTAVSLALHAQQAPAAAQPRLLCMLFDLNTMDAAAQAKAVDNAIKFVQEQTNPADRVEIMTHTATLNLLQDFTDNHDNVVAALRTITPVVTGIVTNIAADAQLAGIQDAVQLLSAFPEKKVMLYFSSGIPKDGIDNQAQLKAATAAATRANISIYPVNSAGLLPRQQ
jgi:VWFA-related protein